MERRKTCNSLCGIVQKFPQITIYTIISIQDIQFDFYKLISHGLVLIFVSESRKYASLPMQLNGFTKLLSQILLVRDAHLRITLGAPNGKQF